MEHWLSYNDQDTLKKIKTGQILSYREYYTQPTYWNEWKFCKIFEPAVNNFGKKINGFYGKIFCPGNIDSFSDVQLLDLDKIYPFEKAYSALLAETKGKIWHYEGILEELQDLAKEVNEET